MAFVGRVRGGTVEGKIGSTLYGVCSTAANVAAKQVAIDGLDELMTGLTIHVKMTNSNTAANPTLTISSVGSGRIPIYRYGATAPGTTESESWPAGSTLSMTYDGTAWQINGWQRDTNTTYSNATQSAAGLMSAADKAAVDKRTTSRVYTNMSTSGWASNGTYSSYPYRASITCSGMTANHFAEVCFNPNDVLSYGLAPVCQTYKGGLYVWAMNNPGRALTGITVFSVLPDR